MSTDLGMLDLSDICGGAAFSAQQPSGTGMVNLFGLNTNNGGALLLPRAGAFTSPTNNSVNSKISNKSSANNGNAAPFSLEKHSAILTNSAKAITLASTFALEAPDADERDFWTLYQTLLEDAERAPSYAPERIGINLAPVRTMGTGDDAATATPAQQQQHAQSLFSANRQWYITHYAFLQDVLMRSPQLRRVALILRWLEASHGQRFGGFRSFRFAGKAQQKEEVRLMREAIRSALRSGRTDEAIRIAESSDDGITACMIAASQMKAHPECWNSQTAVVPLFGEYAHGDEPLEWCANNNNNNNAEQKSSASAANNKPWTNNKDRIDHLATLWDWSELTDVEADEAVIAAILSGNETILNSAFDTNRWQDALWITARCGLLKVFTKVISGNGEPVAAGAFRDRYENFCSFSADWVAAATQTIVDSMASLCQERLTAKNKSNNSGTAQLPFAEELQIRFILQTIGGGADSNSINANSLTALSTPYPPSSLSFFTAVSVTACRAFADRLVLSDPQKVITTTAGNSLSVPAGSRHSYAAAVGEYCASLITNPRMELKEAARRSCQLLFTILDTAQRAQAVAELVLAARTMWYNSYVVSPAAMSSSGSGFTTSANPSALTSNFVNGLSSSDFQQQQLPPTSSLAVVSSSSPSSQAQLDQRRASVASQEQWLLQLVRRYNVTRFGAGSDEGFMKHLLAALSALLLRAEEGANSFVRLTSDRRAEAQLWRVALWSDPKDLFGGSSAAAAAATATSYNTSTAINAICDDLCQTITELWCSTPHQLKAITEVVRAYNKFIRPSVEAMEASSSSSSSLDVSSKGDGVYGSPTSPYASPAAKELCFWAYFSAVLAAWDSLSTTAVHAAEARQDHSLTQLAAFAMEEKRLRGVIVSMSNKALSYEPILAQYNPACAGAILKCCELNINAAVVGISFPGQSEPMASVCAPPREQILLLNRAIAMASPSETADLFAAFRMMRFDAGVVKLKSNVAAALA